MKVEKCKNKNNINIFRLNPENESENFAENIKRLNILRYNAHKQEETVLFNILPEYSFDSMENIAETQYYEGNYININMSADIFFFAVSSVIHALAKISSVSGEKANVPLDCIICDIESKGIIHFLYADFSENPVSGIFQELSKIISEFIARNKIHPLCRKYASELSAMLEKSEDLYGISTVSDEICLELSRKKDFFISGIPDVFSDENADRINYALEKSEGHLYIQSSDLSNAINSALEYAHRYNDRYVHIAIGNASEGIEKMLMEESFRLNSDYKDISEYKAGIINICNEPTLLIICDYSPVSEKDNIFISRLSEADILFAVDNSFFGCEDDFYDYNADYIII